MKYIIDRFEGAFAVCEDMQGNMIHIERERIPIDAKEGDVICITDTGIKIDTDATEKRKLNIEELAKDLWLD
jgi:hypothetical protein